MALCYHSLLGDVEPDYRARMNIFYEFCHPTRWYSKLIAAVLALAFFTLLAAGIVAGYMVYRVVAPVNAVDGIDLTNFPGHPEDVSYGLPSGGQRKGWFFPGLTSAPVVVLCPGYQASRGESLPLAAAIQEHGYNVFMFDIEGSGNMQYSTLGFREVGELRAAMAAVSLREDVDRSRYGLWGTDLGGYVAMAVAESDSRVKAITVESLYDHPQDMANVLIDRQGVASLPLLGSFAKKGFYWLNYTARKAPPLSANLARLAGTAKLFLTAPQEPVLAQATQKIFSLSPDPKDLVAISRGQYSGLVDEEKRMYEDRLVSFFLTELPLNAQVSPTSSSAKTK
jgi:pimeloyl-ACP methyl ester carboxylesterase